MKKTQILFALLLVAILASCTPVSQTGSSRRTNTTAGFRAIFGTIPDFGQARTAGTRSIASAVRNNVAAFQVVAGTILDYDKELSVPVEENGDFALEVPYQPELARVDLGTGYVLLVINNEYQSLEDKVDGVIAVNDGTYEIVSLPMDISVADLDLGNLVQVDDLSVSNLPASLTQQFDIGQDQLAALAGLDDMFKTVKNQYINTDQETGKKAELYTTFMWENRSLQSNVEMATGEFFGIQLRVETDKLDVSDFESIVQGTTELTLQLPQAVYSDGSTFQVLDNSEMVLNENNPDYINWINENIFVTWRFNRLVMISTGYPAVNWLNNAMQLSGWLRLQLDNHEFAAFDCKVGSPFDGQANLILPFPKVKVNTDTSGIVESIEISWMIRDPASGQLHDVPISEMLPYIASMKAILKGNIIAPDDIGASNPQRFEESLAYSKDVLWAAPDTIRVYPAPGNAWRIGNTAEATGLKVDILGVAYMVGMTDLLFEFKH